MICNSLKNASHIAMLAMFSLFLSACQTPEQMAEKQAQRTAMEEAKAAERIAKAEAKMAAYEKKLPVGFERLTGDALTKIVSNTTITGLSDRDPSWSFTVFRNAEGMMKGVSTDGSTKSTDTGKWWIEADAICSQWNDWRNGQSNCNRVYSNGDYIMTIGEDGTINDGKKLKWTNTPGNVANL